MPNTVADTEETCCTGSCDGGTCAAQGCPTCGCGDDLVEARNQWEREFREELERLQKRVADLEAQNAAHASRQICALMTEIDSLERNILGRDVTTSQLKKAGMQILDLK